MPTSSSSESRLSDTAVRAAVIRLSRPDGDGGAVIERAAILAEGTPAAAIEAWIVLHGGVPELPTLAMPVPGLYGRRPERPMIDGARPPRRYVLPATALHPGADTKHRGEADATPGPEDAALQRS
jgi:hypothetical protein